MNIQSYFANLATMSPNLAYLETIYPRQAVLPIVTVAEAISMPVQTVRNHLLAKTFPIPTFKQGARRMCLKVEVAAYLDRIAAERDCVDSGQHKVKRGARTKAERIRASATMKNETGGQHG